MNGFNSKKASTDQVEYEEPIDSETRSEYVDLQPTSVEYRRYDELKRQLKENVKNVPMYIDILPESENYGRLDNLNPKKQDISSEKQFSGSKLYTFLTVSLVVTCITSTGVTALVFQFVNNDKSDTGQAVCVLPDGTSGIQDVASFYIPEIESECPDGWLTHKNSCYKEYSIRRTWYESRDYCRSIGVDLVSVLDYEEANFLDANLQKFTYWIGLTNFKLDNNFTWSDGSQYSYSNWESGEPNNFNNNEHCGQLVSKGSSRQWNDNNCFMSFRFVCKKRKMPQCGPGSWFYYDNSCYLFETNGTNSWEDARSGCRNIGADLVSINSMRENDFVVSRITKLPYQTYWIGLSKQKNGKHLWVDESNLTVLSWGITVPNKSDPNCVNIFSLYGLWRYGNCYDLNGYICEKKIF